MNSHYSLSAHQRQYAVSNSAFTRTRCRRLQYVVLEIARFSSTQLNLERRLHELQCGLHEFQMIEGPS